MVKKIAKYPEVADMMPKNLTRSTSELNPLPNILIIGHLLRLDEVNEECFKQSLETVRRTMPLLLNTLITTAYELMTMYANGTSIKKITAKNIQMLIYFKQCFTQGLWMKEDPHLQLPHFNDTVIKKLRKRRVDLKL